MNRKISNESLVAFLFVDRALRCVWCITIWIITNPPIPGKPLKAHRPLIPAYSFTQKWWRGTIEAEGPRCAFFPVGSICLALHSSGWKVFVLQRVVLFRSRASSGTQTNHIWRSFWYFGLIFQRRLFPRKWKRVWKCLFPVWKQRLRDTQIFRRITNNRFMQVSCKVFTALRHESRGTEEN